MLTTLAIAIGMLAAQPGSAAPQPTAPAQNVVIIMTDDQGLGDLGFTGNPVLRTPNIDRLARESAQLTRFYVSPVCTPTRAALMTGRHTQRTHAIDTYIGRAMLEPEEVTLAEILSESGFATGIFGKWHLGDCSPSAPNDQGFDHALVHRGGGIGQPADPPGGEGRYTDPVLFENGARREMTGYCTDIYFDQAAEWIAARHERGERFFAYIPTNAPHGPFHDVPTALYEHYRALDLSPGAFPQGPHPYPNEWDQDLLARIFAMIENIDANVGNLLETLEAEGILDDTLVIYMHDNGPNTPRYTTGLRGMKASIYEGGIRSPLFARLPGAFPAGHSSPTIAAHYDILPTVLDVCGIDPPADLTLDGRSLAPLLRGDRDTPWPERHIVMQAHRGDHPVRHHNAMIRDDRWKLVSPSGFGREIREVEPRFELYDTLADPAETRDLAGDHPEIVARLAAAYDAWFDRVGAADPTNYLPVPIEIGSDRASSVALTRQDWRRADDARGWGARGVWTLDVRDEGPYDIRFRVTRPGERQWARISISDAEFESSTTDGEGAFLFESVSLPPGVHALTSHTGPAETPEGAYQIEITRR